MRLEKIDKLIEDGYLDEAKKGLKVYYLAQDKADWTNQKREEYDALFKTVEVKEDDILDEDGDVLEAGLTYFDYVEDCKAFDEWLKETKQVLIGTETATDDEGNEYEKEIFEDVLIRIYTPPDVTDKVETYLNESEAYLKQQKEKALSQLDITTLDNGLRFYTDIGSLLDLISADREAERLNASDSDATTWKTPDGNKIVTIGDIRKAVSKRLNNKAEIVGVK